MGCRRKEAEAAKGSAPPLPAREATMSCSMSSMVKQFQSTLPAGEATITLTKNSRHTRNFNPRFPRGKRPSPFKMKSVLTLFQSTLPAREATHLSTLPAARSRFQSTLPAKEAPSVQAPVVECLHISIHASHEGSDVVTNLNDKDGYKFQSTLPAREATSQSTRGTTL